MSQKHLSHPVSLLFATALMSAVSLSGCSNDSTPVLGAQSGAAARSTHQTGLQSTASTLPQLRSDDPALGLAGGISDVPSDSIRFDDSPILDTVIITIHDTITYIDTLQLGELRVDTVEVCTPLTGEWLRFSAYIAARNYIRQNFSARAGDRFSSLGEFCDYNAGTPAGRAGFLFRSAGDSTYYVQGYTFEYLFGAIGFVWGAREGRPPENTYSYGGTMRLHADGTWEALNLSIGRSGDYIRDTRHD